MTNYFNLIDEENFDDIPEPEWLIGPTSRGDDGILMRETLAALVADKAHFKTFLALDWALHIANDIPEWQGHPVEGGKVLYIVGEGGRGIGKRIKAWRIANGVARPDNFRKAKFQMGAIPLLTIADESRGETYADVLLHKVSVLMKGGVDMVIVDTLSRNMGQADENSTRDMALMVEQGGKLKDELGACVLFLHHNSKAGSMRGNTALPGGLDTIITLARPDVRGHKGSRIKVHCDKQKDAEEFADFYEERRVIDLGLDTKGKPVNSIVLDFAGLVNKESEDESDTPSAPVGDPEEKRLGIILGAHMPDGLAAVDWQAKAQRANVCGKTKFYTLVKKMEAQGDIQTVGEGRLLRWIPTKDFMNLEMAA